MKNRFMQAYNESTQQNEDMIDADDVETIFGIHHLRNLCAFSRSDCTHPNKFPLPFKYKSKNHWFLSDVRIWLWTEAQRWQRNSDHRIANRVIRDFPANTLSNEDLDVLESQLRDAIYPDEKE
jgi:hypothetical protein